MKKRLLSGSFALFLLALLTLSWSQQQTRSRGARSLLATPCKGKKWQSSKGPHEQPTVLLGFFLIFMFLSPSPFCTCLMPFATPDPELPQCGVPVSIREARPWSREDHWENRGHREALLVIFSFTTSHIVTYVYRPRARLAAGLHIEPPASPASRGHGLSRTVLTEGRESGCFSS